MSAKYQLACCSLHTLGSLREITTHLERLTQGLLFRALCSKGDTADYRCRRTAKYGHAGRIFHLWILKIVWQLAGAGLAEFLPSFTQQSKII